MSQQELLEHVLDVLDRLGTAYMVTGSVASGMQGRPRATHDVDVVVQLSDRDGIKLAAEFQSPRFYLEASAIREAIARKSMFNLIDVESGDKVDFWILTDEPFHQSCFSRRYQEATAGRPMYIPAPEDTILLKLRWAVLSGGSEKQFTDALGVFEVQSGAINLAYCESWLDKLGVRSLWDRLLREAKQP